MMTQRPKRLGLTGGIGSGKSTVGQMLAEHGAALIDADQIVREVTGPEGSAMPTIARIFGSEFVDSRGALDREKMRVHVFSQASARQQLEAIIHPLVARFSQERAQTALNAGAPLVVFDIPLLVESKHWAARLNAVLVVDCHQETQIARVMARNGLERAAIERILAAQANRQERLAHADMVLCNDGLTLDALREQVSALVQRFGL